MNVNKPSEEPEKLSIDDKLALVYFKVDEEPHINVDIAICRTCKQKPCLYVCPVENYKLLDSNDIVFSWEGCLECGACRVICPKGAIGWNYPRGGFGVCYRFG